MLFKSIFFAETYNYKSIISWPGKGTDCSIVYFFFALKRNGIILCFESKSKSKRMDVGDEALIFERLETIPTIYCTLSRLTI